MTGPTRFTGDAEPYRPGRDPYADYRHAECAVRTAGRTWPTAGSAPA